MNTATMPRTISYTTLDKDVRQMPAARRRGVRRADQRRRARRPPTPAYDEARKVWNGTVDRRPALIARCLTERDVQAAVRFAAAHRMLLSVRGGGHHIAGNAVADGGLMIDLSGMRDDPRRRRERAPRASAPARCSATSIAKRRRTAWPRRSASTPPPASPGSRSAAASAG